jgi:hypothetical protein
MIVLLISLGIGPIQTAKALTGITAVLKTPYATLEQSNSCDGGPRSMYVQFEVLNSSGGTINNLTATGVAPCGIPLTYRLALSGIVSNLIT